MESGPGRRRQGARFLAVRAGLLVLGGLLASAPTRGDDGLVGLAIAPGGDDGVAWSAREIRTLDGGRELLAGTQKLAAVTVSADGTVFAVRGRTRFGVAAPNAAAVWRALPMSGTTIGLALVGDHLAWSFATSDGEWVALTADQGRRWSVQKLPRADHGRLRLLAGGALELVGLIEDCHGGDYSVRYRGRIGSNRWRLTHTGAETEYGGPTHFGTWGSPDEPFRDGGLFVTARSITYWIREDRDRRQRLMGTRAGEADEQVIDERVPDGLSLMAADARGRLLGVTRDNVWRWSAATGWTALRPRH